MEQTTAVSEATSVSTSVNDSTTVSVSAANVSTISSNNSTISSASSGVNTSTNNSSITATTDGTRSNAYSIEGKTIRTVLRSYASTRYDTFDEYENLTGKIAEYERDLEDEYYDQADDYDYDGDWN